MPASRLLRDRTARWIGVVAAALLTGGVAAAKPYGPGTGSAAAHMASSAAMTCEARSPEHTVALLECRGPRTGHAPSRRPSYSSNRSSRHSIFAFMNGVRLDARSPIFPANSRLPVNTNPVHPAHRCLKKSPIRS